MGGNVTAAHLTYQIMEEYIHYSTIVNEIIDMYARSEDGARCGDETCLGIQTACNLMINKFAEYNPDIKRLYDENRDEYTESMMEEEEY